MIANRKTRWFSAIVYSWFAAKPGNYRTFRVLTPISAVESVRAFNSQPRTHTSLEKLHPGTSCSTAWLFSWKRSSWADVELITMSIFSFLLPLGKRNSADFTFPPTPSDVSWFTCSQPAKATEEKAKPVNCWVKISWSKSVCFRFLSQEKKCGTPLQVLPSNS